MELSWTINLTNADTLLHHEVIGNGFTCLYRLQEGCGNLIEDFCQWLTLISWPCDIFRNESKVFVFVTFLAFCDITEIRWLAKHKDTQRDQWRLWGRVVG